MTFDQAQWQYDIAEPSAVDDWEDGYDDYLTAYHQAQDVAWGKYLKDVEAGDADSTTREEWDKWEEDPWSYGKWVEHQEESAKDAYEDRKFEEARERKFED